MAYTDDTTEVIMCRTVGHAWDDFTPIGMARPQFGKRLSLRCTRCATQRHDLIDRLGQVGSRRYIYADGYRRPGEGRPDRAELRLALLRRRRRQER